MNPNVYFHPVIHRLTGENLVEVWTGWFGPRENAELLGTLYPTPDGFNS